MEYEHAHDSLGNPAATQVDTHLYSAFGFPLDVLNFVSALTHHVLHFVGRELQFKVRLFFAVAVWRQQLVQLRDCRLLPILQRQ